MTTPDATAGDGLREAMLGGLVRSGVWPLGLAERSADDLLALPALRDVLAAAEARGYERGRRDFQFAPEGDNHHNAVLCPYCSPFADAVPAAAARDAEKVRRVEELAIDMERQAPRELAPVRGMAILLRAALDPS